MAAPTFDELDRLSFDEAFKRLCAWVRAPDFVENPAFPALLGWLGRRIPTVNNEGGEPRFVWPKPWLPEAFSEAGLVAAAEIVAASKHEPGWLQHLHDLAWSPSAVESIAKLQTHRERSEFRLFDQPPTGEWRDVRVEARIVHARAALLLGASDFSDTGLALPFHAFQARRSPSALAGESAIPILAPSDGAVLAAPTPEAFANFTRELRDRISDIFDDSPRGGLASDKLGVLATIYADRHGLRLPWRLLPPGTWGEEWKRSSLASPRRKEWAPRERLERISRAISLFQPAVVGRGSDEFDGYVVLINEAGSVAVLEHATEGNATYVMGTNWRSLCSRSKGELLRENSAEVRRVVHEGDWPTALAAACRHFGHAQPFGDDIGSPSQSARANDNRERDEVSRAVRGGRPVPREPKRSEPVAPPDPREPTRDSPPGRAAVDRERDLRHERQMAILRNYESSDRVIQGNASIAASERAGHALRSLASELGPTVSDLSSGPGTAAIYSVIEGLARIRQSNSRATGRRAPARTRATNTLGELGLVFNPISHPFLRELLTRRGLAPR